MGKGGKNKREAPSQNPLVAVSFEKPGNLGHKRVIRIRITQQGADGEQHLCHARSKLKDYSLLFTLLMVRAGDHCDLRMSRQIEPLELMFGW